MAALDGRGLNPDKIICLGFDFQVKAVGLGIVSPEGYPCMKIKLDGLLQSMNAQVVSTFL